VVVFAVAVVFLGKIDLVPRPRAVVIVVITVFSLGVVSGGGGISVATERTDVTVEAVVTVRKS
jgi:hypothetical protein